MSNEKMREDLTEPVAEVVLSELPIFEGMIKMIKPLKEIPVGTKLYVHPAPNQESGVVAYIEKSELEAFKKRGSLKALLDVDPDFHTQSVPLYTHPTPEAQPATHKEPVNLNIIRKWPEGFSDRLEHVWKDLLGFTPNYKLYDLQRVLAEFGFTMVVYEGDIFHPTPEAVRKLVDAAQSLLDEQNGTPLIRRATDWMDAVSNLQAALAEVRSNNEEN